MPMMSIIIKSFPLLACILSFLIVSGLIALFAMIARTYPSFGEHPLKRLPTKPGLGTTYTTVPSSTSEEKTDVTNTKGETATTKAETTASSKGSTTSKSTTTSKDTTTSKGSTTSKSSTTSKDTTTSKGSTTSKSSTTSKVTTSTTVATLSTTAASASAPVVTDPTAESAGEETSPKDDITEQEYVN